MNWENCGFDSDSAEEVKTIDSKTLLRARKIFDENEQKRRRRLEQLRDPIKDEYRKTYIAKAYRFGELLLANNYEEIVRSHLTEDCETFLFNFGEIVPVKYVLKAQDLTSVYQGGKVIKREVKETNVDSKAFTAFQICYCEILNEKDQTVIPQFSMEVFSFRDDKIKKYRASFGSSLSFDQFHNPFTISPKEKMIAKAKQFSYAWADQPDFERIASLFDPSTEYKIWRWQDHKLFTFDKSNFAKNIKNSLEENYEIKCVVPYHVYTEGQYIMNNYVFYLEDKTKCPREKFIWLCNSIYSFDKDLNITKINQQGELFRQDEIEIPFPIVTLDEVRSRITNSYTPSAEKKEITFLDNSNLAFSIELSTFGLKDMLNVDHVKGFSEFIKLSKVKKDKGSNDDWDKIVDFYSDNGNNSYPIVFTIECLRRCQSKQNDENTEVEMDFYAVKKFYVENCKVVKVVIFFSNIPQAIPTPYDDNTFTTQNIKPKEDIFLNNWKIG